MRGGRFRYSTKTFEDLSQFAECVGDLLLVDQLLRWVVYLFALLIAYGELAVFV